MQRYAVTVANDLTGRPYVAILSYASKLAAAIADVEARGAEVVGLMHRLCLGDLAKSYVANERMEGEMTLACNAIGIPTLAVERFYGMPHHVMIAALGVGPRDAIAEVTESPVCESGLELPKLNTSALHSNQAFLQWLAHEAIASRAPVLETYDKQVQGRVVVEAGWTDATVVQPFNDTAYPEEIRQVGLAVAMSGYSNDEAMRQVVAVGAEPLMVVAGMCIGRVMHAMTGDVKRPETALVMVEEQPKAIKALQMAMAQGMILSMRAIAVGGVTVALAKMSFKQRIGMVVDISGEPPAAGFVLEVARDKVKPLLSMLLAENVNGVAIGLTTREPRIRMNKIIDVGVMEAEMAWENGLRERLI